VAGRVYCNLSREVCQHTGPLLSDYPFASLKADPRKALAPQPVHDPSRAGALFWLLLPLRLPFHILGSLRRIVRLGRLSKSFAAHFRHEILPGFAEQMARAAAEDWSNLSAPDLLERFHFWSERTLVDYARASLKPTALAATARASLEFVLRRKIGGDRARAALGALSMGVRPDPDADLPGAMRDLLEGKLDRAVFLQRFGHRGNQEMELAQPRWGEDPTALDRLLRHSPWPAKPDLERAPNVWNAIADEAKLSSLERTTLEPHVHLLRTYLSLRETAKHYFMRGYALLRRALLELDARHRLQGGIFYLTPEELTELVAGKDVTPLIAARRRRRTIALSGASTNPCENSSTNPWYNG
jgi:hypothetical protein